jgi:type IV pilus assembly protein PilN
MSGESAKGLPSRVGLYPATEIDNPPARRLASIRINLLPHRELRRERRKKDFVSFAVLVGIAGAVAAFAGGVAINQRIDAQRERNDFIRAENAKLDVQIGEITTLRAEISALRARQQAVENLQSDRTVPVHLFDELVRLAPEGLYLRHLRQDDGRIALVGHAQTNERVAELLRNLADRSRWLTRPELGEIKEITLAPLSGHKEGRKVYEFSLNALVKRPAALADPGKPGKPGAPRATTDASKGPAPVAAVGAVGAGPAR